MKNLITGLITCICILFLVSCSNTPTSKAKAYLDDMKDGNYRELVDQLYFKKETTDKEKQDLANMLEEKGKQSLEKEGAIKSYEITGEEVSETGEKATINYTLTYEDGSQKDLELKLINIDGEWLVDSGK